MITQRASKCGRSRENWRIESITKSYPNKPESIVRSTLQIIVAVTESQPVSEEELRLALLALSGINHFIQHDLDGLVEAILEEKLPAFLKMKAQFAKENRETMFLAIKKDPKEWLGPGNIPGNPEYQARMKMGKAIFKKATGIDL